MTKELYFAIIQVNKLFVLANFYTVCMNPIGGTVYWADADGTLFDGGCFLLSEKRSLRCKVRFRMMF